MRRLALSRALLLALVSPRPPAGSRPSATDGSVVTPPLLSTSATWTKSTSGSAIIWDAVAFAGSTCRLVQFGGTDGYVSPTATNLLDPKTGTWTSIRSRAAARWPSFRTLARMAWDPVRQRVILFGGRDGAGDLPRRHLGIRPGGKDLDRPRPELQARQDVPPGTPGAPRPRHGLVVGAREGRRLRRHDGRRSAARRHVGVRRHGLDAAGDERRPVGPIPLRHGRGRGHAGRSSSTAAPASTRRLPASASSPSVTRRRGSSTRRRRRGRRCRPPRSRRCAEMGMAYVASIGAVVMATGGTVAGCQTWTNSTYAYDVAAKDWRKLTTSGGAADRPQRGEPHREPLRRLGDPHGRHGRQPAADHPRRPHLDPAVTDRPANRRRPTSRGRRLRRLASTANGARAA